MKASTRLSHPLRTIGPCRSRYRSSARSCRSCPERCRRRRSPRSPTAPWPSASRSSTGCPEPPSAAATKGTLVHAALEGLMLAPPAERTLERALAELDAAGDRLRRRPRVHGPRSRRRPPPPHSTPRPPSSCAATSSSRTPPGSGRSGSRCSSKPRSTASGCAASSTGSSSTTTASWSSPTTRRAGRPTSATSAVGSTACTCTPCCASAWSDAGPSGCNCSTSPSPSPSSAPQTPARSAPASARWPPCGRRSSAPTPATASGPSRLRLCDYCAFQAYCPAFGGDPAGARRLIAVTVAVRPEPTPPPALIDALPSPDPATSAAATKLPLPPQARSAIASFDAAVDAAFDRLRGHPLFDRAFYVASELGDYSLIWHLVNTARGLRSDDGFAESVRLAAGLGVESALVNGLIKSAFRRRRPSFEGVRPHHLAPAPHEQLPEWPRQRRVLRRRHAVRAQPRPAGLVRVRHRRGPEPRPREDPPRIRRRRRRGRRGRVRRRRPPGVAIADRNNRTSRRRLTCACPPSPSPGTTAAPSPATPMSTSSSPSRRRRLGRAVRSVLARPGARRRRRARCLGRAREGDGAAGAAGRRRGARRLPRRVPARCTSACSPPATTMGCSWSTRTWCATCPDGQRRRRRRRVRPHRRRHGSSDGQARAPRGGGQPQRVGRARRSSPATAPCSCG